MLTHSDVTVYVDFADAFSLALLLDLAVPGLPLSISFSIFLTISIRPTIQGLTRVRSFLLEI